MIKIVALALLGVSLVFVACDNPPAKTTSVEFSQSEGAKGTSDTELGSGIRVKFFTSSEYQHTKILEDVQRQLSAFINGGQYEVVRVTTTHCPEGHLLSAEVYYRTKK